MVISRYILVALSGFASLGAADISVRNVASSLLLKCSSIASNCPPVLPGKYAVLSDNSF